MNIAEHFTFEHCRRLPFHRWFYYKEAYSPLLVGWALSEFGAEGRVFDPFLGIGTTALAAKQRGLQASGIDVSPLAVFVSKVKCDDYSDFDVKKAEDELALLFRERKAPAWEWDFELFSPKRFFGRRAYNDICCLRGKIEEMEDERLGSLFLLALLSALPQCGFFIKDGGVLRLDPRKSAMPVKQAFRRKAKQMLSDIAEHQFPGPQPELKLGDARDFTDAKAEVFVTSPPYLNNIDYSKVYGLELSLLTMQKQSTKEMRGAEVRSFITGESFAPAPPEAEGIAARVPIAGSYFADMEKVLRNLHAMCGKGGCLVVGNSVMAGEHIPVDEILIRIGERLGLSGKIAACMERTADVKPRKLRVRESAIFFEK